MKTYLFVYLGAALLVILATPCIVRLARALGLIDAPGTRKVHSKAVPRLGGIPIAIATLALVIAVLALDNRIAQSFRGVQPELAALLGASIFILLAGIVDDIWNLRARVKLLIQLAAATSVCAFGIRIDSIGMGQYVWTLGWLAWPVTIFWIVGITNALNIIDGLDGLAAGIAAMTCGVIAMFSFYTGQPIMAVLMLSLLGGLSGFLFFNFNPAKIFLGDCGSLFIGFILASSSIMCTMKSATLVTMSLTVLVLGVPIFDMFFSILRRLLERRSIFAPDGNHIHHRLLRMGLTHRGAVFSMYLVTFSIACLSVLMMALRDREAAIVLLIVLAGLLVLFHVVGAIRLRESWHRLMEGLTLARQIRQERRCFEGAQLQMRGPQSFQQRWKALCDAADSMDFLWLRLSVGRPSEPNYTASWRRANRRGLPRRTVRLSLPGRSDKAGHCSRIDAVVAVNGSLEAVGRRITLLSRLIDEYSLELACAGPSSAIGRRTSGRKLSNKRIASLAKAARTRTQERKVHRQSSQQETYESPQTSQVVHAGGVEA